VPLYTADQMREYAIACLAAAPKPAEAPPPNPVGPPTAMEDCPKCGALCTTNDVWAGGIYQHTNYSAVPPPAAQAAGASMEPVAWAQSRTIDDDDGRPIGSDEPRVVWGAEDPDPGFGWWPLYPAPVAAISAGDVWLEGWKACRREVFGLCEHTIDEELPQAESEHHAGYQRGRYQEAKAIARAMNSFEPTVPDHLAPKEK
jgi:hypothetical protein